MNVYSYCKDGHLLKKPLAEEQSCPKCCFAYDLKQMRDSHKLSNEEILNELTPNDIDSLFEELDINKRNFWND